MTEKFPCKECGTLVLPSTIDKTNGRCMPCYRKEFPFWPIDFSKLTPAPTGEELVKINENNLRDFNKELFLILESEIKSGNRIVETHRGWPNSESIFISMEKPFITKISNLSPEIIYREINDPYYWKAEYYHEKSTDILVCRF